MTLARAAIAVAAGTAMFLACPDFDLWPLMWVALAPVAHLALTASTHRRAFLLGWLAGTTGNLGGFYWMRGLLERFGHMPTWQAAPIMGLLVAYQGLQFAFFAWGLRRAHRRTALPLFVLSPLVMVVVELAMPMIFPFYLGISQAWVTPVLQIAELTGPTGVTALMLMTSGAIVDAVPALLRKDRRAILWPLAATGLVVAGAVGWGHLRLWQIERRRSAAPKAKVGIVQANVGILEKWIPSERERLLRIHQDLTRGLVSGGAELVVWPESSYPYPLPWDLAAQVPRGDGICLGSTASNPVPVEPSARRHPEAPCAQGETPIPLIFGAVTYKRPVRAPQDRFPYNTAFMMDREGRVNGRYDKVFLLAFGEYIPFYERLPWFQKVFPSASHFNRGRDPTVFPVELGGRGYRVAPLICYEDILPGFTRRAAALRPNLFVNITNDAWFGKTSEPWEHLALSVFRSVEHRLEMVRAVNTGVSAHIDAGGRVRHVLPSVDPDATPKPEPASALVEVALLDDRTVYAVIGDTFAFACAGALVLLMARRRPKA